MGKRRDNPWIHLERSDLPVLASYRTKQHKGNVRIAKKAGRTPKAPRLPLRGVANLASRSIGREWRPGPGRRRPGEAVYFSRQNLFDLAYLDQRHPGRLSATARRALDRELALLQKTPRWTVTDSTETSKLGKGFRGGTVGAIWSPRRTCPTSCPIYADCYASEAQSKAVWQKLSRGFTGYDWNTFIRRLRASKARLLRVNVAGDLPGDGRRLDRSRVLQLAAAASANGRVAFTYTHYPPNEHNLDVLRAARRRGLQINLSADNLADADRKAATGFDVAVVLPHDAPANLVTPGGRPIVRCPQIVNARWLKKHKGALVAKDAYVGGRRVVGKHTYAKLKARAVTCATCGGAKGPICSVGGRAQIVGFPAHGKLGKRRLSDASVTQALLTRPRVRPLADAEVAAAAARARGEAPTFAGRTLTVLQTNKRRRANGGRR